MNANAGQNQRSNLSEPACVFPGPNNVIHEPMYIFIAALLVNSVLLSSVIHPKFLVDFLSERQIISYSACQLQFFLIYSIGASEFLLLSAMAYDRYISICKPFQYPTIMRNTTVSIFLFLAWILPSSQVAVTAIVNANAKLCSFTLNGIFCNNTIYTLLCESKVQNIQDRIVIFNTVGLPVVFILFSYTRILIISYQSSKAVRTKAAETCVPHFLVLISFTCVAAFDVIISGIDSDLPKTVRLAMLLQIYPSLFNPIIYGLKMKEISKHIKRLFSKITMTNAIN
ncbi:LOW QUALITY PROTEIN: olfactory receptor 6N2-like [Pholidichthys leucotaenia]